MEMENACFNILTFQHSTRDPIIGSRGGSKGLATFAKESERDLNCSVSEKIIAFLLSYTCVSLDPPLMSLKKRTQHSLTKILYTSIK